MDEITINDIGTSLQITIEESDAVVDVSAATGLGIILKSPSGVESTKSASNVTDGSDGQIQYITDADDINEVGIWSYRGRVTYSATSVFTTRRPRQFRVVK